MTALEQRVCYVLNARIPYTVITKNMFKSYFFFYIWIQYSDLTSQLKEKK